MADRIKRWLFRSPLLLYRAGLGWLLGRRFLRLTHTGRKSGEPRYAVLELVATYEGDPVVAVGFGRQSHWFLNIQADPAVGVVWGRERFDAEVQVLDRAEARSVLEDYQRRHPIAANILSRVMGKTQWGSDTMINAHPVVRLRRTQR